MRGGDGGDEDIGDDDIGDEYYGGEKVSDVMEVMEERKVRKFVRM